MGTLLLAAAKIQLNLTFVGTFFFSFAPHEVNAGAELRLDELQELQLEIDELEKMEEPKPKRR